MSYVQTVGHARDRRTLDHKENIKEGKHMIITLKEAVKKYKKKDTCRYFLKCKNKATTTIFNPILGDVPACRDCADFCSRMSQNSHE
jgi:hypothetical protein